MFFYHYPALEGKQTSIGSHTETRASLYRTFYKISIRHILRNCRYFNASTVTDMYSYTTAQISVYSTALTICMSFTIQGIGNKRTHVKHSCKVLWHRFNKILMMNVAL